MQTAIRGELQRNGNNVCAECFTTGPTHASLKFGIYLCQKCAAYHKRLTGSDESKVVSILAHKWQADEVQFMRNRGNIAVNLEYEPHLPHYYHRPGPDSPQMLREQWVQAKYEREEFKYVSQQSQYSQGSKTGALFKRAKDANRFQRRKFILKEPEGLLQYFIKYSDKNPKDVIKVQNLVNIYIVPEKVGNVNGMQITYEKEGTRRNLFVFGEDGKTTTDWYHALRMSMSNHKYKKFPESEIKRFLNTAIAREGWMSKTGPTKQEKFRKRWFCLIGTMLWYYEQPLDPHPLGYIPLGSKTFGYGVMKGYPQGVKTDAFGMTVHTPDRVFVLSCETLDARDKWVECITKVLETCTNVWSIPSVGRLGSSSAKTIDVDNVSDDETSSASSNMFAKMSKKMVEDLDLNSNPESTKSTSSTGSPVKQKRKKDKVKVDTTENDQAPKAAIRTSRIPDEARQSFLEVQNSNTHGASSGSSSSPAEQSDLVSPLPAPRRRQSTSSSSSILLDSNAITTYFLRKKTSKRVPGTERKTVKPKTPVQEESFFNQLTAVEKNIKPKHYEITLINLMEESLWFMLFQTEDNTDVSESYVTPWIGTQIAECPASVGPIKIPHEFEIAVIDKTPGDFGLDRTTGPFCVEPGDIWEVEVVLDDGSAPEMYYHEGMATDDETIMVYANEQNIKNFDVAIFKSGRKLVTRKGIKPGESANMKINEAVYLLSVDQNTYTTLHGEDIRTTDLLPKATCIQFNAQRPKAKISAKREGSKVLFLKQ